MFVGVVAEILADCSNEVLTVNIQLNCQISYESACIRVYKLLQSAYEGGIALPALRVVMLVSLRGCMILLSITCSAKLSCHPVHSRLRDMSELNYLFRRATCTKTGNHSRPTFIICRHLELRCCK